MSVDNIIYILLQSLSSIFAKAQSTNNYKVLDTIANDLSTLETEITAARTASTVSKAGGSDLDLHGKTFDIQRVTDESDVTYRQRLLDSYVRGNVTWNNLKRLVEDYSIGGGDQLEGYQWFYDRWWLGGKYFPAAVTENVNTITGTIVRASSGCFPNTIPECWLQSDTEAASGGWPTGTNYASGSTFVNDASGALITLTTPVTADTPVTLIYTPNVETSGDLSYDQIPHSFLNRDAIIRHRSLINNFILVEETNNSTSIRTNMLPEYPVFLTYYDSAEGTVYNWETTVDKDKYIILDETKRTDNLIVDEYSLPDGTTEILTSYEMGNVQGVWLATDPLHIGTNYATTNNFSGKTITLDTELPIRTGVITTYNRYHIPDYTILSFDNYFNAGNEDFRFSIEFDIYQAFNKYGTFKYGTKSWGELTDNTKVIVGKLVDLAKAAGIKSDIVVMVNEVKYGNKYSIYGEVYYGGSVFVE